MTGKHVQVIVAVVLSIVIFGGLIYFNTRDLTPKESGLLSILLTILSIMATWIVSHLYSEASQEQALREAREIYSTNLKTYALKASEKVNNLSNELTRLVNLLENELEDQDFGNIESRLMSREYRIEDVIHLVTTLKNANDTSLSDWKGVIGEELEQQEEKKQEKLSQIEEILSNITALEKKQNALTAQWESSSKSDSESEHINESIQDMKETMEKYLRDIRRLVQSSTLGVAPGIETRKSFRRQVSRVEKMCPVCSTSITYRHKSSQNMKGVYCANCGTKLISHRDVDGQFSLTLRVPTSEQFSCLGCQANAAASLDPLPGSQTTFRCHCGFEQRLVRKGTGFSLIPIVPAQAVKEKLDEEVLAVVDLVRSELPVQPWPKDTHKAVAEKLDLNPSTVSRAIQILIHRGIFKPQVDGKVIDRSDP